MVHPLILQLDSYGDPARWINYERAVFYFAKDLVSWSVGENETTIFGGKSRMTGNRSFMNIPSIIAVKSNSKGHKPYKQPILTNRALFRRDHHVCAFDGRVHQVAELTRDHVIPSSKGGRDIWQNVVTACGRCNRIKDDRTPEEADMPLVYVPYAPSKAEYLILMNRSIKVDQMEFLLQRVDPHSRLLDKAFLSKYEDQQYLIQS